MDAQSPPGVLLVAAELIGLGAVAVMGKSGSLFVNARVLVLLPMLLVAGCASVPFDHPRTPSEAIPMGPDTSLGRTVTGWMQRNPGQSGFYPLADGLDALGARLRLIESAEVSIDAQYFLIKGDDAGALFAGALLRAADRGVRVRFLIDDVFTPDLDAELGLLDAHPNVEVRMFNPLPRQGLRLIGFLADFQRANRRMHNKSLTVDGALTVVGGRNIANEYFRLDDAADFSDFDLLVAGPAAAAVAETFDLFWNSPRAVPIHAFGHELREPDLDAMRRKLNAALEQGPTGSYARAVDRDFLHDIVDGTVVPTAAPARVVTDHPEKLEAPQGIERAALAAELGRIMREARQEIILVTPYFVPGDSGVEFLSEIRARGVRVVVVTNSLASTNHVAVHSGYFYRRRALLEAGIELYEFRPDASPGVMPASPPGAGRRTLHTKAAVVDRSTLFVGSLNLDPRSIEINTEMGVFVDSPLAAAPVAERIEAALPGMTYRVTLNGDALQWKHRGPHGTVVESSEPRAGFWRTFSLGLFRLLPIEDQL